MWLSKSPIILLVVARVLAEDALSTETDLPPPQNIVQTTPTGRYSSYSSTFTVSSSAITTEPIVSTITSDLTTKATTIGSTTIFGIGTISDNATALSEPTETQTLLVGRPSTSNGTANATSSAAEPAATNETPCNNYPQFCSRKYSNITEISAHNSPFVRPGNAGANQALPVSAQLNDGVRLLQAQVRFVNETPHFCHTSCQILDAGPITKYLGEVYDWVSENPYDVVTILLGNGDYRPVVDIAPYVEKSGLLKYAYSPPKIPMTINDWPTLSSMIITGKRVVFFMDYEANQTAVPWILDQFSQMWETPFSPTDRAFPCTIERPPALLPQDAPERMYIMNHNLNYEISILGNSLLVPNIPLLPVTNNETGFGSLGENSQICNDTWHYPPRFLNVDYYNVGNGSVFKVAAKFNNVTYDAECCGHAKNHAQGLFKLANSGLRLSALVIICHVWFFFL
ncbi:BgTH12-00608 [Blumeria graminis f. sp. triticale]|uniref:Bgt-1763 n=2 Tax=Blumeria graminis TaxID=34373 RepID=A0A9X9MM98_BLUGR|nr:BgTH12-00608 [Blumeria graminis f. sp. triticale]VDB93119.1 Bgt-1763 [Blumeria graminis f. sp. tritici]